MASSGNPPCFYPDGSRAIDFNYTSCGNPQTGYSTCCYPGEGDQCLTTLGLCYWPPQPVGHGNYIYRAACTDKSWTDGSCSKYCVTDDPNHYETVSYCPDTDDFCCYKSVKGDCCQQESTRFPLNISTTIRLNLKAGASATPVSTSAGVNQTTFSGSNGYPHSTLTKGAIAGIALGVLIALLLLLVGVFFYRTRRARNAPDLEPREINNVTGPVNRSADPGTSTSSQHRGSQRVSHTVTRNEVDATDRATQNDSNASRGIGMEYTGRLIGRNQLTPEEVGNNEEMSSRMESPFRDQRSPFQHRISHLTELPIWNENAP